MYPTLQSNPISSSLFKPNPMGGNSLVPKPIIPSNSVPNMTVNNAVNSAPVTPKPVTVPQPVQQQTAPIVKAAQTTVQPAQTMDMSLYNKLISSGAFNGKNFALSATPTIDSTHLVRTQSTSDLFAKRQKMEDELKSGTGENPALQPSNSLYKQYADKIYQTSQYSPEEVQGLQNIASINSKIEAQKLAQRREIARLMEDGNITKEEGQAFINEFSRRADQQAADLALQKLAETNSLGVLGQLRGNNLEALQNAAALIKPTEVSPGSTLFNPITGVQYQGQGGSPQAVLSYAQQLMQNDQSQGTLKINPDGSINQAYYQQLAQQSFNGSLPQSIGEGGQNNQLSDLAQMLVSGQISPSQIPPGINQVAVLQTANELSLATTGVPFNASEAQANYSATQAALQQNATTYRTLANAQSTAVKHLNDLEDYYNELPEFSKSLPFINGINNYLQSAFGNKEVQAYRTTLETARGEIAKVLAGGGAPSDAENNAARSVLPDNMSPAQFKGAVEAAKMLMQQKIQEYSNTSNVPKFGQSPTTNQGGLIQTKVGAINPNF